jgi:hypothetical protein
MAPVTSRVLPTSPMRQVERSQPIVKAFGSMMPAPCAPARWSIRARSGSTAPRRLGVTGAQGSLSLESVDGNIVEVVGTDILSRDERLWIGVSAEGHADVEQGAPGVGGGNRSSIGSQEHRWQLWLHRQPAVPASFLMP